MLVSYKKCPISQSLPYEGGVRRPSVNAIVSATPRCPFAQTGLSDYTLPA